jgi:two-component system, chemotaxis family, response regulator PixH
MSKILLVEDSEMQAELIARCLEKQGFFVFRVGSGEEAQLRLKQQKPSLIVLDVILPGQSGFELCRQLKNNPDTKNIPIIMCSTKNTEIDRTWGEMSGANAYITKPIDEDRLVQTVNQLLVVSG